MVALQWRSRRGLGILRLLDWGGRPDPNTDGELKKRRPDYYLGDRTIDDGN